MNDKWQVELLGEQDWAAAGVLLESVNLTLEGEARQDTRLWGIRDGETWVGLVGLSPVGEDMLLRSLGVDLAYRQGGLGGQLTGFAVAQAGSEGAGRIFLLTTTAAAFFEKYGFRRLERDAVPPAIARHRQFTSLCPDSAVVMVLER